MNKRHLSAYSAAVAAYREGLGLAAVAVLRGPAGISIATAERADDSALAATESVEQRWWCRRATDAERVAAAAAARLRRGKQRLDAAAEVSLVHESVERAASQLGVALHLDDEIFDEAMAVVAKIDAEIASMQRSGELRSVNQSYQKYRIETSGRGEPVMRYQDWMRRYRESLVRKLAATLRFI